MATAIYPGSFDPVTKGHLDIIKRAAKISDHTIVAGAEQQCQKPLFTVEEQVVLLTGSAAKTSPMYRWKLRRRPWSSPKRRIRHGAGY